MKKLLWTIIFIAILSLALHWYFKETNTKFAFSYLEKFPFSPSINCYEEGIPRTYFGPKAKKGVLLLHGYGASPSAFDHLTAELKKRGIPYYAPLITGFGIGDFHLLDVVLPSDWLRDAVFGFDLLSSFAEEVDVVGHSEGGVLSTFLSAKRDVHQLILVDPYLFSYPLPTAADRFLSRLIMTPVIGNIITFLCPVIKQPKDHCCLNRTDILNPKAAENAFVYKSIPIHSLQTLWRSQNMADAMGKDLDEKVENGFPQKVYLLYGEEDQTIDIEDVIAFFKKHQIPVEIDPIARAAHDPLIDYTWRQSVTKISEIIGNN